MFLFESSIINPIEVGPTHYPVLNPVQPCDDDLIDAIRKRNNKQDQADATRAD